MLLKGIFPGRNALFVNVLGVVNRDTLNVLGFGVAPNILDEVERVGDPAADTFVGDPAAETFVGDGGRLAGD